MCTSATPNDPRLSLRLPSELKQIIKEAAALTGQSVGNFATSTLLRTARKVIEQQDVTRLSNRDRDVFVSLLDEKEVRPNKALMTAARRYKNDRG
jgi:uncharacterized protein (DUF1778 family)